MCRSLFRKTKALCMSCKRLSVQTNPPIYQCLDGDEHEWIQLGWGRLLPGCLRGIGFNTNAEIWHVTPTRWLVHRCDPCEEWVEQVKYKAVAEAEEASTAYEAEPAAAAIPGPATSPISTTRDPTQVVHIHDMDHFFATVHKPELQLLEARFPEGTRPPEGDEVPDYTGFAQVIVRSLPVDAEQLDKISHELKQLQKQHENGGDQQTWDGSAYIDFLKRNPGRDSNLWTAALREYYTGRQVAHQEEEEEEEEKEERSRDEGPSSKRPRLDLA